MRCRATGRALAPPGKCAPLLSCRRRSVRCSFSSSSTCHKRHRSRRVATRRSGSRACATSFAARTRSSRWRARDSIPLRGSKPRRGASAWCVPPPSKWSKRSRSPPSADVARGAAGERAPHHGDGGRVTEGISPQRLRALFALFAVATLLLSLRVGYWQTLGRSTLLDAATDQLRSELALEAQRGVIRDRNGAVLATTVDLRSLYAIPKRIPDRGDAAAKLAPVLATPAATIRVALDSGAEWLYLKRRLPEPVARAVEALAIPGLGFEPEPKRLYPNDALAANLLGFVNDDGAGQYGVEGAYDKVLRGVPGRLVAERDPKDRERALGLRTALLPKNGADLVLTIDLVVQTAIERELRRAVEREKLTSGSILVVDPRDGAILGLASWPTFDPARVAVASSEALRNRAVSWAFEPGSTMKAVTIAAGIDTHAVTPTTTYDDNGCAVIGGRRLCNAQGKVYGTTTVTQILERSANAGAVFVASKLGQDPLYAYLRAFGFGEATGIDLAAEATGAVRPLAQWYPVDVGTIAFGQGIAVTPLQLAMAYATIANGGTLYRPYVVAATRDADGEHRTAPV